MAPHVTRNPSLGCILMVIRVALTECLARHAASSVGKPRPRRCSGRVCVVVQQNSGACCAVRPSPAVALATPTEEVR